MFPHQQGPGRRQQPAALVDRMPHRHGGDLNHDISVTGSLREEANAR
jgi:hypothetical protein